MRFIVCFSWCVLLPAVAMAQADLLLMLNPNPNTDRFIFDARSTYQGESDDDVTGDDFELLEENLSFRYGAILEEDRELYVTVDATAIQLDTSAIFDESGAPMLDDLYNVGIGAVYRQTVHEDWRVGGQLRIGSASDKPFNSLDEMYLQGLAFLQIPHLEYTSWIMALAVNTHLEIPVFPAIGYSFPVSRQALAVVGLPFFGAAGKFTDEFGFRFIYWPVRNLDISLDYQITDWARPYTGFRWRGRYFARADRADDDERIRLEDMQAFVGTVFDVTENVALDARAGYVFGRQVGEGDGFEDQRDNNFRVDDTWFISARLGLRF